MQRPHVYGDEAAFRRSIQRHIKSGETLLAQGEGSQRRMDAIPDEDQSRMARYAIEAGWSKEFRRWFEATHNGIGRFLQDQFGELMPVLSSGLPPDTGKPRHTIHLPEGREWLERTVEELKEVLDAVAPTVTQPPRASMTSLQATPKRSQFIGRIEALAIAVMGALIAAFVAYKIGWV